MFFDRKAFQRYEDGFSEEALAAVQTIVEPDRYKDAFEVLKMIRAECQFEMGQIGVRLSWLLAAQTLLVSAAVNAISNALNQNTHGPAWLAMLASGVSLVGVFLSLRSLSILNAAIWTIDLWHERKRLLIDASRKYGEGEARVPRTYHAVVLGRWLKKGDPVHQASLTFARAIPYVFLGFWCIVLLSTIWLATRLPVSFDKTISIQSSAPPMRT